MFTEACSDEGDLAPIKAGHPSRERAVIAPSGGHHSGAQEVEGTGEVDAVHRAVSGSCKYTAASSAAATTNGLETPFVKVCKMSHPCVSTKGHILYRPCTQLLTRRSDSGAQDRAPGSNFKKRGQVGGVASQKGQRYFGYFFEALASPQHLSASGNIWARSELLKCTQWQQPVSIFGPACRLSSASTRKQKSNSQQES